MVDREGRLCYDKEIIIVLVTLLLIFFVSISLQCFTRNIQDTSTKLSSKICRLPEQIKFEYYNSNSGRCNSAKMSSFFFIPSRNG